MPSTTSIFFDKNANIYGAADVAEKGTGWSETLFLNFIKTQQKPNLKILDVGCGDGKFAERISSNLDDISITVIDPSQELLNKISDPRINKIRGELPRNFSLNTKFDFIHLTDVLHHVTGSSITGSRELVKESILNLKTLLNDDGLILIKDLFMESSFNKSLSRSIIFHLLNLQNKIRIKIPSKEFLLGLTVCFYTRAEMKQLLRDCGLTIVDYREDYRSVSFKERLLFTAEVGRMTFFLKKR